MIRPRPDGEYLLYNLPKPLQYCSLLKVAARH